MTSPDGPQGRHQFGHDRPALDAGAQRGRVDDHAIQAAQVEHEGAVGDAVTGLTVSAASHRDLEPVRLRELETATDVVDGRTADNGGWTTVDGTVPDLSRLVVGDVVRQDNVAVKGRCQVAKALATDRRECTRHIDGSRECSNTTPASCNVPRFRTIVRSSSGRG